MVSFPEKDVRVLFARLNMLEAALRDFGKDTLAGQVATMRIEFIGPDGFIFPSDRIAVSEKS